MIAPMLAVPLAKANITDWSDWRMEEKYDGHRLIVVVTSLGEVTAYTRERKHAGDVSGKSQATRDLPPHLVAELRTLKPRGLSVTLDGELLAILPDGRIGTSTDVTRTDLQGGLRFVAFDVLTTAAGSSMMLPYEDRRRLLEGILLGRRTHVLLADSRECCDTDTVSAWYHEVRTRGGEGLILKQKRARYEPGKRRASFVKIKSLYTAVARVTGFEATRGTVLNRGQFAKVTVEIVQPAPEHPHTMGLRTSVKTLDDAELAKFNAQAQNIEGTLTHMLRTHPALGRLLRIEYQDLAADGGLRHPRWDRWEDE
jgi:ATP-dependent DNA ligase